MSDEFDRIAQTIADLPDVRVLPSQTVTAHPNPLSNDRTADYIVHTARSDRGLTCFVRYLAQGADGETVAIRLVLPPRAMALVLRQAERLTDRSTPDSRKRAKRRRELDHKRRDDHRKGRHEGTTPGGRVKRVESCPLCR